VEGFAWDVYSSEKPRIEMYCVLIAGSPDSSRYYRPGGQEFVDPARAFGFYSCYTSAQ
jgi:hypothetical protein